MSQDSKVAVPGPHPNIPRTAAAGLMHDFQAGNQTLPIGTPQFG